MDINVYAALFNWVTMKTFDFYGFKDAVLVVVVANVQQALGIRCRMRGENEYSDRWFWYQSDDRESIELFNNYNVVENACREPEFEEYSVLLYVNGTALAERVKQQLASTLSQAVLIRHEEL